MNFGWRARTRHVLLLLWEFLFGSRRDRTALAICGALLVFIGFIAGRIYEGGDPESLRNAEKRATNMMGILEAENRLLKKTLQNERLHLNLSEKNLNALRRQMEELGTEFVRGESEISFFKQLLQERSQIDTEIGVRSFDISPDFREDSYTLGAVLIRNANAPSKNFSGAYDLALNVDVNGNSSVVYYPEKGQRRVPVDFRFYHEINAPFQLPPGAQILNARFSVYDPEGELVVSKILVEEAIGNEEPASGQPGRGPGLN